MEIMSEEENREFGFDVKGVDISAVFIHRVQGDMSWREEEWVVSDLICAM